MIGALWLLHYFVKVLQLSNSKFKSVSCVSWILDRENSIYMTLVLCKVNFGVQLFGLKPGIIYLYSDLKTGAIETFYC